MLAMWWFVSYMNQQLLRERVVTMILNFIPTPGLNLEYGSGELNYPKIILLCYSNIGIPWFKKQNKTK